MREEIQRYFDPNTQEERCCKILEFVFYADS